MEILELLNIPYFKQGNKIHIKEKNKGKFTEYCGGEVTNECIQRAKKSKNPKLRKRAIFVENSRSWKHAKGGQLIPKHKIGYMLDYDPENPYHVHNNGEKIVITPEQYEKHKDEPYFANIRKQVEEHQAAYPEPEYTETPNPEYQKLYANVRAVSSQRFQDHYFKGMNIKGYAPAPEPYITNSLDGVVTDKEGNLYRPMTQADAGKGVTPMFTTTERDHKDGREFDMSWVRVKTPPKTIKTLKQPLPVDRTYDVDKEYKKARKDYLINNSGPRYIVYAQTNYGASGDGNPETQSTNNAKAYAGYYDLQGYPHIKEYTYNGSTKDGFMKATKTILSKIPNIYKAFKNKEDAEKFKQYLEYNSNNAVYPEKWPIYKNKAENLKNILYPEIQERFYMPTDDEIKNYIKLRIDSYANGGNLPTLGRISNNDNDDLPKIKTKIGFEQGGLIQKHQSGQKIIQKNPEYKFKVEIPKHKFGNLIDYISGMYKKITADDYTYIDNKEVSKQEAFAKARKDGQDYFRWNGKLFNTKLKPADKNLKDYSNMSYSDAHQLAKKNNLQKFAYQGVEYTTDVDYGSKDVDLQSLTPREVWERITQTPWSLSKSYTGGNEAKHNLGLKNLLINLDKQGVPLHDFDWNNVEETKRKLVDYGSIRNQNDRNFHHGEKYNVPYFINPVPTELLYGFNIPYDESPITIKSQTGGKNTGTVIYPTILDSLASSAMRVGNISPEVALGLAAQESTYGNAKNYWVLGEDNSQEMLHSQYFKDNLNYYGKRQIQSSWNHSVTPFTNLIRTDGYTHESKIRPEEDIQSRIKEGFRYELGKFATYNYNDPVLDWSFKEFKAGKYNKKDPNHTKQVINRGKTLIQTPEIQDWFYNHFLPSQPNKEKWKRWWN